MNRPYLILSSFVIVCLAYFVLNQRLTAVEEVGQELTVDSASQSPEKSERPEPMGQDKPLGSTRVYQVQKTEKNRLVISRPVDLAEVQEKDEESEPKRNKYGRLMIAETEPGDKSLSSDEEFSEEDDEDISDEEEAARYDQIPQPDPENFEDSLNIDFQLDDVMELEE